MIWPKIVSIVLAVAFALVRFHIPSKTLSLAGTYQVFAHLFVGFLIGAAVFTQDWFWGIIVVLLSVVEVTAFITRKPH